MSSWPRWTPPGAGGLAGFDTVLAKGYAGGTELSGGQWQRVALARAMAAVRLGAGLVLLDEPTAQLDVRGEAEIFERVLAATRSCTTILVSHRFSTVRHADRIAVVEDGAVAELGSHDELMALRGRYWTMFSLQAQRFETGHARGRRGGGGLRCPRLTRPATPILATPATPRQLPPALSSMWRLCKPRLPLRADAHGRRVHPRPGRGRCPTRCWRSGSRCWARACSSTMPACCGSRSSRSRCPPSRTWLLQTVSTRIQRRFRDKVTIALESHVARLQASISTIAHQERPEYLDRLSVLREQIFTLDHMYMSVFSTAGWILRLAVTVVLLATVNPVLILLVVFAMPTVAATSWRPVVERTAQERGAQSDRLARHLFTLTTTASPGKELRVLGIGPDRLADRRRGAWEQWYGPVAAARTRSSAWYALGWAIFASATSARSRSRPPAERRSAASAILVLTAGARLSSYVGATVGEIGFLRGIWMDGSRRLAWLEDYASGRGGRALTCPPRPARPTASGSSTSLSATRARAGRRSPTSTCSCRRAASSRSSGENGAGKTTLVKLLAKLYHPSSGRILIDGTDLARIDPEQWRQRLAGRVPGLLPVRVPGRADDRSR